ncbi:sugar phosphate isomerase/epimerase [Paenibacillus filicis]|uniref:Sugar phosphate isomerase/epimerase n=1 Tax=Paenibacillus gyeongsangnamensis TaxID=3388067 RepID=A0ABT4QES1_9BACL|nr:sugar phosphate isomerase/epimerase [Paenibacillus filicis]MCZ8515379.1 sugar phosphate isomerase/epimerase [Paenibacillus filicis]
MHRKFAAQLSTVRDLCRDDFPGILRELKRMGWAGVQISGLLGYDSREIAAVMRETGLQAAGIHVPLNRLQNELDEVVNEAKLFETRDIVLKVIGKELRTEEGYRSVRGFLNEVARKLAPEGFRISYHNHAFELESHVEGKLALEYLLEPAADNRVLAEIDVYWVKKGNRDPLLFLEPYANRMPIIHLKDMTTDEEQTFAEVGTGSIDFAPILDWCEANGVEWYAVEQDVCPGNPMDSLQISLNNLMKLAERRQARQ